MNIYKVVLMSGGKSIQEGEFLYPSEDLAQKYGQEDKSEYEKQKEYEESLRTRPRPVPDVDIVVLSCVVSDLNSDDAQEAFDWVEEHDSENYEMLQELHNIIND